MFVRVYTGEDGESHFEGLVTPLEPVGKSPIQPATSITFF
jgi:hypothetical protein